MLKHNKVKKLGRSKDARKALFRSLTRTLIEHGAIETSEARAKAVRGFVGRVVKVATQETSIGHRRTSKLLATSNKESVNLTTLLNQRNLKTGNATRIVRLGNRLGDNSPRVRLELITEKAKKVEKSSSPETTA